MTKHSISLFYKHRAYGSLLVSYQMFHSLEVNYDKVFVEKPVLILDPTLILKNREYFKLEYILWCSYSVKWFVQAEVSNMYVCSQNDSRMSNEQMSSSVWYVWTYYVTDISRLDISSLLRSVLPLVNSQSCVSCQYVSMYIFEYCNMYVYSYTLACFHKAKFEINVVGVRENPSSNRKPIWDSEIRESKSWCHMDSADGGRGQGAGGHWRSCLAGAGEKDLAGSWRDVG